MKPQFYPAEMVSDENLRLVRVSAAMDFLIEVENDVWRRHVIAQHGAMWPWRKQESRFVNAS